MADDATGIAQLETELAASRQREAALATQNIALTAELSESRK